MSTVPEEVGKPGPKEVGKIVQFIPRQESEWREGVVQQVQQVVPAFKSDQAVSPAAAPIPNSEALKQVKAERVNSEEPELAVVARDANNLFKIIRSWFTGEGFWARFTKGRFSQSIKKERDQQLAGVPKKDDDLDQLDIAA